MDKKFADRLIAHMKHAVLVAGVTFLAREAIKRARRR